MIVAAGLSPAWQQIYVFDDLELGEVNRAAEVVACASGKVLNVAIALHHLEADVRTVTLVGSGTGEAIRRELEQRGIAAAWVLGSRPTRVCTTLLERSTGRTTELVENCAAVTEAELARFLETFAEAARPADWAVLIGSLPPGTPSDYYRRLAEATPARILLDARGPELLEALTAGPFLIKPNRRELEQTVGRPLVGERELLAAMGEMCKQGAEWVLVTDGAGPVWLCSANVCYRLTPLPADVVNPIGCGDCLAAAIADALQRGRSVLDAVRFGIAAAADNLSQLRPARLDRARVEDRWSLVQYEEVPR